MYNDFSEVEDIDLESKIFSDEQNHKIHFN
jgi:hypothetical protein